MCCDFFYYNMKKKSIPHLTKREVPYILSGISEIYLSKNLTKSGLY